MFNELMTKENSRNCNLCKVMKRLDEFYPHKACKAGRAPQCKACISARAKLKNQENIEAARAAGRNSYARNRESRKTKVASYRRANPEKAALAVKRAEQKKPEKYAALHQAWAERNRNKTRAATRKHCAKFAEREAARQRAKSTAFRLANSELVAQRYKAWAQNHPLTRRVIHHRRRAAKLGAAGNYTNSDVKRIFASQGHRCNACHLIKPLEIDHIVPLQPRPGEPAGSNDPSNLQGLCRLCNIRKKNLPWNVFLARR